MGKDPTFILIRIDGQESGNFNPSGPAETGMLDTVSALERTIKPLVYGTINMWKANQALEQPGKPDSRILKVTATSPSCEALDSMLFLPPSPIAEQKGRGYHVPFKLKPSTIQLIPTDRTPHLEPWHHAIGGLTQTARTMAVADVLTKSRSEAARERCGMILMILPRREFDETVRQLLPQDSARALGAMARSPLAACLIEKNSAKTFFPTQYMIRQAQPAESATVRLVQAESATLIDISSCTCGPKLPLDRPCACVLQPETA